MSHADQLDASYNLAVAFLQAEVGGDEGAYRALLGPEETHVFADIRSASPDPALWAALEGERLQLGVASVPGATARVVAGSDEALSDPEVLADDIALVDGWVDLALDLAPDPTRDLWIGVELDGEAARADPRRVAARRRGAPHGRGADRS